MDARTRRLVKQALKRGAFIYCRIMASGTGGFTYSVQVERPRGRSWKIATVTHPVMENAVRSAILEAFGKSES